MSNTNEVSYKRHQSIFNPNHWTTPVTVIGVGGVGSHVAYHLAKLGVGRNPLATVMVYDDDYIEVHNPPNQAFQPRQVGQLKVKAVEELYLESSGVAITTHAARVEAAIDVRGILFLCLDTMHDRDLILDAIVWENPHLSMVVETRMDAELVKVLTMDPCNPAHRRIWKKWYYTPDSETENMGGCDGHLSIGTKTDMTAIFAVEQLIAYAQHGSVEPLPNELSLTTSPWVFRARHWNTMALD